MGVGIKSWELMLVSTISTFFCPTVKLGTTSGIHISFIFCLFNFSIDCPSFRMCSPPCVLLYINRVVLTLAVRFGVCTRDATCFTAQ